jgi:hypothetical protein
VGAHPSLLPPSLPPLMNGEDGHIDVCTHACTHACTSTPDRCFSSLLHRAPSRFEILALDMHVWSIISACALRSMLEPIATIRSPWRVQGWANVHCAHVRRSPAAPTPVRPHRPPSISPFHTAGWVQHSTQQVRVQAHRPAHHRLMSPRRIALLPSIHARLPLPLAPQVHSITHRHARTHAHTERASSASLSEANRGKCRYGSYPIL